MCGPSHVFGVPVQTLERDFSVCLQVVVSFCVYNGGVVVDVVVFLVLVVRVQNSSIELAREGVLTID